MVIYAIRWILTFALVMVIFRHAHWSVGVFAALVAIESELIAWESRERLLMETEMAAALKRLDATKTTPAVDPIDPFGRSRRRPDPIAFHLGKGQG